MAVNLRPKASSTLKVIPYCQPGTEPTYAPTGSLVWNEATDALRVKQASGLWVDVGGGSATGVWLYGTAAPGAVGNDGDFFLNRNTGDVYIKIAGTWTLVGNIAPSDLQRPLWYPPATPGSLDWEGTSDPGWIYYDSTGAASRTITTGAPSMSVNIGATGSPVASFGTQRRSWLRLQVPNTGGDQMSFYYHPSQQTPTLPIWYWCRIASPYNVGGAGSGYSQFVMTLADNSAGHPDVANQKFVGLYAPGSTSPQFPVVASRVASADTSIGYGGSTQLHEPIEYFAILKTSTSFSGYAIGESGAHYRLGNFADTRTTFWLGFWLRWTYPSSAVDSLNPIFAFDFFRTAAVGATPPWIQP